MSKLENLEGNREVLATAVDRAQIVFSAIDGSLKGDENAKKSNKGWALAKETLDEATEALEKLDKQIADEKATAAAAAIIEPFVTSFGTVSLSNGSNAPANFHVVDLEKNLKEARDLVARGNDRVKLYEAAQKALTAAKLPEGQTIERPIHFVVEGNSVKITIASRGGGARSGGTRVSGSVVRITGSKSGNYIGETVGAKDSTYASWREFISKNDPDHFAALEKKREEKNNNYSAKIAAEKHFGLTMEPVAAEPAAEKPAA